MSHTTITIKATSTHAVVTIDAGFGEPDRYEYRRDGHGHGVALPQDIELDGLDRDVLDDFVCELMFAYPDAGDIKEPRP